jgi:plasmid stabilization system protein ParE
MARYTLSREAEKDLDGIIDYTLETWGLDQARLYFDKLVDAFERIAEAPDKGRLLEKKRNEIRFLRVQHHYIFYHILGRENPLILAVFHERMQVLERLRERLNR